MPANKNGKCFSCSHPKSTRWIGSLWISRPDSIEFPGLRDQKSKASYSKRPNWLLIERRCFCERDDSFVREKFEMQTLQERAMVIERLGGFYRGSHSLWIVAGLSYNIVFLVRITKCVSRCGGDRCGFDRKAECCEKQALPKRVVAISSKRGNFEKQHNKNFAEGRHPKETTRLVEKQELEQT